MDAVAVLSGDAPVLAVRVTQLAGGGSILAVTASHVVLGASCGHSYVLLPAVLQFAVALDDNAHC
jgi:hypothetical protein